VRKTLIDWHYITFARKTLFSPLALHLVAMYMKVQNKRTFTSSTFTFDRQMLKTTISDEALYVTL
jgi:hypothetical protein